MLTPGDMVEFAERTPPRALPKAVRRALAAGRPRYLRNGGTFLAFAFLLGGLFFVYASRAWESVIEWAMDRGWTAEADGRLVAFSPTRVVHDDNVPPVPILAYHLVFPLPDGTAAARCYGRAKVLASADPAELADFAVRTSDSGRVAVAPARPVRVTYFPPWPRFARVPGATVSLDGSLGLMVFLFPLVGLSLLLWSGAWHGRTGRVARRGLYARGVIVAMKPKPPLVEGVDGQRATIRYLDADGAERTGTLDVYGPDIDRCLNWRLHGDALHLLYRPDRPRAVAILDLWTESPHEP